MKKRIIALLLTFVLAAVSLCGCGNDANYFTKLKDLATEKTQISEATVSFELEGEALAAVPKNLIKDGKLEGEFKFRLEKDESSLACIVSGELAGKDYGEITTISADSKYLYVTTENIMRIMQELQFDPTGQMINSYKQMGMDKAIKVDLKQLAKNSDINFSVANVEKYSDDIKSYVEYATDTLEKYFVNLCGKDGEDFTLRVDKKNVEKAVDDIINFLNGDVENFYNKTKDIADKIYGMKKDSSIFPAYKDVKESVENAKKNLKDSKKDIVKSAEDGNFNIVSKVDSDDKTVSFSSDNLKMYGSEASFEVEYKAVDGKANVKKLIPKDATDVTALLNGAAAGALQ